MKFQLPVTIVCRTFFRYFRVDLERPCPYWQEDGQCAMEGCSVCTCDDAEIPRTWLDQEVPFDSQNDPNSNFDIDYGWIASENSDFKKTVGLDRLNMSASQLGLVRGREYLQYLRDTEDDDVGEYVIPYCSRSELLGIYDTFILILER